MPLYEFFTTGEGDAQRTGLREVSIGVTGPPKEIPTPSGVDLEATPTKLWKCKLCEDTKFKAAGLAARHFNSNHQDHKEGKESWRDYIEVIDGPKSG